MNEDISFGSIVKERRNALGLTQTELARRVGQERTHLYRKLKSLGLQTKKQ